jgi:transcriptional regulator with XRE-family HTH domain
MAGRATPPVATSDMTYSWGMIPDAASLIRDARSRHGVSQETLARRARTTQKQISRIESGGVSPSVSTLSRLLAAMGERLELGAVPGPRDNRSDEELRADFTELTASERIAQTAALSRTLTGIAAGGR